MTSHLPCRNTTKYLQTTLHTKKPQALAAVNTLSTSNSPPTYSSSPSSPTDIATSPSSPQVETPPMESKIKPISTNILNENNTSVQPSTTFSNPYTRLSTNSQAHLSNIVYFILAFHEQLNIPAYQLLHNAIELSLLQGTGIPFDGLVKFLTTMQPRSGRGPKLDEKLRELGIDGRLGELSRLVDDVSTSSMVRTAVVGARGTVQGNARATVGIRDSTGKGFTWLKGTEECASGRVVIDGRLFFGKELDKIVDELIERRGIRDIRAAGMVKRWVKCAEGKEKILEEQKQEWELKEEKRKRIADKKARERQERGVRKSERIKNKLVETSECENENDYMSDESDEDEDPDHIEEQEENTEDELEEDDGMQDNGNVDFGKFVSIRSGGKKRSLRSRVRKEKNGPRRSARIRKLTDEDSSSS